MILIDANESRWNTKKNDYTIKWVRELVKLQEKEKREGVPKDTEPLRWMKIDLGHVDGVDRVGPDIVIQGMEENISIERKDVRDFIASVVDDSVFEQVYEGLNKVENARPILLTEGSWTRAFAKREYLRPMAMGAYAKFISSTKLQFVHSQSAAMTANLVRDWNRQLNDGKEYEWKPKKIYIPSRKPAGLRDIAYTMLMSIPKLGASKALSIVANMPEPKTIANLTSLGVGRLNKIVAPKSKSSQMAEVMYRVFNCPLEREEPKSSLLSLEEFLQEEFE